MGLFDVKSNVGQTAATTAASATANNAPSNSVQDFNYT
jgi:hypothetical protein